MSSKKVLVLGCDGYLGHPISLNLGHQKDKYTVVGIDNGLKDRLSYMSNSEPIFNWSNSIRSRHTNSEDEIIYNRYNIDVTDYEAISTVIKEFNPDTIIHLAEQPSGPFSLMNVGNGDLTIRNNVIGTYNILWAMKEYCRDAHLIKFGTAGEYGESNVEIPEGWLEYEYKGRKDKRLFPRQAGSLYHTCKVLETDLIWFFVRMFDLRVTDLMQGPVYGFFTDEITLDNVDTYGTKFYYDDIFGTVVNRFIAQAVKGQPLTVYGKGGQTRGYINLLDVIQCINLIIENPPKRGVLDIYNQVTETLTVNEIAEKVKLAGDKLGLNVKIESIENPRKEAEEHYYKMESNKYAELGLKPNLMTEDALIEMLYYTLKHEDKIDISLMKPRMTWDNKKG